MGERARAAREAQQQPSPPGSPLKWLGDKVGYGRPLTAEDGYTVAGPVSWSFGGPGASLPPVGGSMGGGGSAGGGSDFSMSAQTYPALEALQGRYDKYLGNLESNSGQIMDQAATRLRDAREGGRENLRQANTFAGRASAPSTANYEAQTQRGVQQAIADVTTDRERTLGSALQGGLGIARAPAELALSEKGLGLQAQQAQASAQAQQAQMQLQQMLALLQAQRSSPIYGGM